MGGSLQKGLALFFGVALVTTLVLPSHKSADVINAVGNAGSKLGHTAITGG